jgi:hypothetical protein
MLFGTVAIVMAMLGLLFFYSPTPILASRYVATAADQQPLLSLMHDLFADIGKQMRLFSELLLGIWFVLSGYTWLGHKRAWPAWLLIGLGLATLLVAGFKIIEPTSSIEDSFGIVFALSYLALGVYLLRVSSKQGSTL